MDNQKAFDELSFQQINLLRTLLNMHDEFGLPIYKNFARAIIDDPDDDEDYSLINLESSERHQRKK